MDYKVRVTAVDEAGNELEMEKEIEGFFGGILEFLTENGGGRNAKRLYFALTISTQ